MTWSQTSPLTTLAAQYGGIAGVADAVRSGNLAPDRPATLASEAARLRANLRSFATMFEPPLHTSAGSGPLAGVPLAIKDNMDVAGFPTTAGSTWLRQRPPATDNAEIVDRALRSGAWIIGRGNMPELSSSALSDNPTWGNVSHPRDARRSPGGSSSGTAAAVAAGLVLGGIGTDTGGSVLIPAAFTGIAGYRPSVGRLPTTGVVPFSPTHDTVGLMAGSVEDLAVLAAALDHPVRTGPNRTHSADTATLGAVSGWSTHLLDPEVAEAHHALLSGLVEAGRQIGHASLPLPANVYADIRAIAWTEAAASWSPLVPPERAGDVSQDVRTRIKEGGRVPRSAYLAALQGRLMWRASVDAAFSDHDFLIAPTVPIVAPAIDADPVELGGVVTAITYPFCFAGVPMVTIPAGIGDTPAASGAVLIGRWGSDRELLELATAIDRQRRQVS